MHKQFFCCIVVIDKELILVQFKNTAFFKTMAGKEINKLLPHVYYECPDLPSLPPSFSCSTCDAWKERMHNKGSRFIHRRDFLIDRYQCTRAKEGQPIKVWVVCQSASFANPWISSATTLKDMERKAAMIEATLSRQCQKSLRLQANLNCEKKECQENMIQTLVSGCSQKRHVAISKRKQASEIINRLDASKIIEEEKQYIARQKEVKAAEVEAMLKARVAEAQALEKEALVDKANCTLETLKEKMEQMKKALIDYEKQLSSKKNYSVIIVVLLKIVMIRTK
jgi:antitoxin component HigA of HigAB toxin-antitoxin module